MSNSSTTPKKRLTKMLTRTKKSISVRFRMRPKHPILQIFITVNGEERAGFSTTKDGLILHVEGYTWNQKAQCVNGNSEEVRQFNLLLNKIRSDINAVYDRQVSEGITPTFDSVKNEYKTGQLLINPRRLKTNSPSVLDCYRLYVRELVAGNFPEKDLAPTTINKWKYGLAYLEEYVELTKDTDTKSSAPSDEVTFFWAKSYHRWLIKQGPMSADSATRYVNRLIEAISYAAEAGLIKQNPLVSLKLPRDKTKEVYFLESEHLERFWRLNLQGELGVACWWMGIIFLTGLDYPDAVRYVQNRAEYERSTPFGDKIVITRSKPPKTECHIPILPELKALLHHIPNTPPPSSDSINGSMRTVEVLIGFKRRLTCKIGRKTAGAIFYTVYQDIGAVSRMLGHSSVTITERYYVKTTGQTVNRAMQKKYVNPIQYQPFRWVG